MLVGPVGRLGAFLWMSKKQNKRAAAASVERGCFSCQLCAEPSCSPQSSPHFLWPQGLCTNSFSLDALESISFRKSSWIHSV